MQVSINNEPTGTVVSVAGEVDADNSDEFGSSLLDVPADSEVVLVDLSGLSFIDSSGISELVRAGEKLKSRGQKLTVRHPSDAVRRVLDITGLLEHFGIE